MMLLVPLLFCVAMVHGLHVRETSIVDIDGSREELSRDLSRDLDFLSVVGRSRQCEEDTKVHSCKCKKNRCKCCTKISPYPVCDAKVCIECDYTPGIYDCNIYNSKDEEHPIMKHTVKRKGNEATSKHCGKGDKGGDDGTFCLYVECQKGDKTPSGCLRTVGKFSNAKDGEKDEVEIDFGCFKM